MKRGLLLAGFGVVVTLTTAGPAVAQQDIPWTWNNDSDHDAKGRFESTGEWICAVECEGNDYIDYEYNTQSGLRWYIPGSESGTQKGLDLSIAEGKYFGMQVCENKTAAPDDCSVWKRGVS